MVATKRQRSALTRGCGGLCEGYSSVDGSRCPNVKRLRGLCAMHSFDAVARLKGVVLRRLKTHLLPQLLAETGEGYCGYMVVTQHGMPLLMCDNGELTGLFKLNTVVTCERLAASKQHAARNRQQQLTDFLYGLEDYHRTYGFRVRVLLASTEQTIDLSQLGSKVAKHLILLELSNATMLAAVDDYMAQVCCPFATLPCHHVRVICC